MPKKRKNYLFSQQMEKHMQEIMDFHHCDQTQAITMALSAYAATVRSYVKDGWTIDDVQEFVAKNMDTIRKIQN